MTGGCLFGSWEWRERRGRNCKSVAKYNVTYLSNQHKHNQPQTDPATINTTNSPERNLIERVAIQSPGTAEADVREADTAPREERSQARQREQPVEDDGPLGVEVYVSQAAEEQDDADAPEGAARSVDVCR